MSQRNPMNERYTVEGNMPGKTRKSASRIKPKTKASSTVVKVGNKSGAAKRSSSKTKATKQQERFASREERFHIEQMVAKWPKSARYKKLRKIWTVSLIIAILCTIVAFFINTNNEALLAFLGYNNQLFDITKIGFLILAYAGIIFTLFLDFFPIKKERSLIEDKARVQYRLKLKNLNRGVNRKKRDFAEYERKQKLAKQKLQSLDADTNNLAGNLFTKFKSFTKKSSPKHAYEKK